MSFVGSAPTSALTPTAALDQATVSLKRWRAKVSRDDDGGVLRFGPTFWSGRSWLSAVLNRQVRATTQGTSTVVEVSASIAPIVILGGVIAVFVSITVNPFWSVLLGLGMITGINYLFVHYGMRRVLAEALTVRSTTTTAREPVPHRR